jgi:hypothetical protein
MAAFTGLAPTGTVVVTVLALVLITETVFVPALVGGIERGHRKGSRLHISHLACYRLAFEIIFLGYGQTAEARHRRRLVPRHQPRPGKAADLS